MGTAKLSDKRQEYERHDLQRCKRPQHMLAALNIVYITCSLGRGSIELQFLGKTVVVHVLVIRIGEGYRLSGF